MTDAALAEPLDLPRLLLSGDAGLRPAGLERALTRAGFRVVEGAEQDALTPPDAILLTLGTPDRLTLANLLDGGAESPPRVILFAAEDPDLPVAALELGADDAVLAPVHLPELCARIHARIRDRQSPRRTCYERETRAALEKLLAEARTTLLPDEIALALARRLARALDLAACSLVAVDGADRALLIAATGPVTEPEAVDLGAHPEILEALHTRRATIMAAPGPAPTLVVPVGPAAGQYVLLLRQQEGHAPLTAAQLGMASSLGEAAVRAIESPGRSEGPDSLERRLQEEFERARRYSLAFALVLLAVDPLEDSLAELDDRAAGRLVADVVAELRRSLRLPDFVSRYAPGGFAILLPETDVEGARRSLARVRDRLTGLSLGTEERRAGLSAGIVAYPHPAVSQSDDMFALVEAALRRGRAQPGERIGVAEWGSAPPHHPPG